MSEITDMETKVDALKEDPEPEKSVEMQVVDSICEKLENGADVEQQVTTASEEADDDEFVVQDEVGDDEPVEEKENDNSQDCDKQVIASTTEKVRGATTTVKVEDATTIMKVEDATTTAKTVVPPVEAPKALRNMRKVARVPKHILEYMMKYNEDDTVTINVNQLKVWVQGELFRTATEIMACDWKTTDVPLMECVIPDAAVDKLDVIVNSFHKDSAVRENERIARDFERNNDPKFGLSKQQRRAAMKASKRAAREEKDNNLVVVSPPAAVKFVSAAASVPAKILPAVPEKASGTNNRAQEKAAVKRPNQSASGEAKKQNAPFAKKQKMNDNRPQKGPGQPSKNKQTFPNKNENRKNTSQNNVRQSRMPDRSIRDQHHNRSNQGHRDLPRNEVWTSPVQPQMSSFAAQQSYTPSHNTQYSAINNQMNGSWSSPWQSSPLIMDSNSNIQPVPPPVPRSQVELTPTALSTLLNRITSNMITGNNGTGLQMSQQAKNERDLTQYIEPLDNLGIGSFSSQSAVSNGIGSYHYNGFTSVSDPVHSMQYNVGRNAPVLPSSTGLPYSDFISPNTFAMTGSLRRDDVDRSGRRRHDHHNTPNNSSRRRQRRHNGSKSHGGSK